VFYYLLRDHSILIRKSNSTNIGAGMPKVFPRQKTLPEGSHGTYSELQERNQGCLHQPIRWGMWHRTKKRWRASISVDGSKKTLGYFDTEVGCSIGLQPSGLKAWTANEHH